MPETRRDFLGTMGASAVGAAGLYLAACGSGSDSSSSAGSEIDVLYDWTYVGPPGTVASYWKQVQTRSASTKAGGTIDQLTEVPVENLFQTVDANLRAKSGPTIFTYFSDFVTYLQNKAGGIKPLDDYVTADESSHWLLASAQADGSY